MPIQLEISPKIIPNIASLYNDVNRIFMEYIDNSLDSAEEWFDESQKSYKKSIEITVAIKGNNYKNGEVIISDNCLGVTNFTKIVKSIGNSDKKAQGFTNGQFGYGIYSFMAACGKLEVISKLKDKLALYIPIESEQFNQARQEDVKFPDPKNSKNFPFKSGTIIKLSNFDRGSWKQINKYELKNEIEKHFESLLRRKNLSIKLIDQESTIQICESFDYNNLEGEVYEDYITNFSLTKGGKYKNKITITQKNPVHIFLKITKGTTIGKSPVFISKGRRICEIKDVKAFKSKHKNELWGHPNVTGYVDVKDLLDPTIARTDFKNTNESRVLFNELINLEDLILDFVKSANKKSEERHYRELENILNLALSKLARVDSMNYRTDYISGSEINLASGSLGKKMEDGEGGKDRGDEGMNTSIDEGIGEQIGGGSGVVDEEGELPGDLEGGQNPFNKEKYQDSDHTGKERKKSGFNIRIINTEPDIDSESNQPLRSKLVGDEIQIYKMHADFQDRVKYTRQGETKITERLITYLAGEITVHYKDRFYNRAGQPEYNKNMFVNLMDFVYQFENSLSALEGKNLSEFS